jgi:hypothetical protein
MVWCVKSAMLSFNLLIDNGGVGKEWDGNAFLTDGGVYQALMLRSQTDYLRRYPQIVSFIGEASKSGRRICLSYADIV